MADACAYAIVGRGAWAGKMRAILESERRRVTLLEQTRRDVRESDAVYTSRLTSALVGSGAQIAWLCVPPGPHIVCMVNAAIAAGMHAIVEKPWLCSRAETESLITCAELRGLRLAVHFEYCLLDEIEAWRGRYYDARGLRFGGRFCVSRPDRLGIPAILNLGCHLIAMRRYAAPGSTMGEICCAYEAADERRVWVENDVVDFRENRQPIIQRFFRGFEAAIAGGEFALDLRFGLGVAEDSAEWWAVQTAESARLAIP